MARFSAGRPYGLKRHDSIHLSMCLEFELNLVAICDDSFSFKLYFIHCLDYSDSVNVVILKGEVLAVIYFFLFNILFAGAMEDSLVQPGKFIQQHMGVLFWKRKKALLVMGEREKRKRGRTRLE